jgi:redox-sensitive bicupin YhaK (pirin superfamily)
MSHNLHEAITPVATGNAESVEAGQAPPLQRIPTRDAVIGDGLKIRRALPGRQKRMIGAWCFLDHAGPADVRTGPGMRVGPHPHIGLQTFTWMIEGEVLHQDSLGTTQIIRPGQVNLMTAGRGICHAESSPASRPPVMHAAQLWIALPSAQRHMPPAFEHYPDLPIIDRDGFRITLLAGDMLGARAPARVYSPLVGVDLTTNAAARTQLPLQSTFEYGVLVLEGTAEIEGEILDADTLLYLGSGREQLHITTSQGARLLLIGGEPFAEEILLWWNFVARTQAEISAATEAWNHGNTFGEVRDYDGERLTAPPLPAHMKASS